MSTRLIAAGCLAGVAVLVTTTGASTGTAAGRRLRRLAGAGGGLTGSRTGPTGSRTGPTGSRTGPTGSGTGLIGVRPGPIAERRRGGASDTAGAGRRPDPIRLATLLAGLAMVVVVGGWFGLLTGMVVAAAADPALRRIESPAARRRKLCEIADLPLAADLLAAALRAGAPVDWAVSAVADALGGPLGERLARVGRTLRLGGEPAEAWSHVNPIAGAERLTAAAIRSASSGAALAGALSRLADDLRADRTIAVEAAARRAGVLIVLPLGLCFLPAFILAGLVPVIVAVLGDVL